MSPPTSFGGGGHPNMKQGWRVCARGVGGGLGGLGERPWLPPFFGAKLAPPAKILAPKRGFGAKKTSRWVLGSTAGENPKGGFVS